MRGLCPAVFLLLLGCASTTTPSEAEVEAAELTWSGKGLVYSFTRPAPRTPVPAGFVRADFTLLELDESVAKDLLGISDVRDISPRSFRQAMGEIAGVNAFYGHGRVLARPTLDLQLGKPTPFMWRRDHVYLQDWSEEGLVDLDRLSPQFGALTEGVEGEITLNAAGEGTSISLKMVSSQLAGPVREFTTTIGPETKVKIQTPDLSVVERVAVETVLPGETAMFQLSRAIEGGQTRIRLLFIRLLAASE